MAFDASPVATKKLPIRQNLRLFHINACPLNCRGDPSPVPLVWTDDEKIVQEELLPLLKNVSLSRIQHVYFDVIHMSVVDSGTHDVRAKRQGDSSHTAALLVPGAVDGDPAAL